MLNRVVVSVGGEIRPSFILNVRVNLTLTGHDPFLFRLPFSTTLTGGTTVNFPSALFMTPESSIVLMISSSESGNCALPASLLEYCDWVTPLPEYCPWALLTSLPDGCGFL